MLQQRLQKESAFVMQKLLQTGLPPIGDCGDRDECQTLPIHRIHRNRQGQTFHGKVVASFGPKEPEHGITYTTMSCVTKIGNFGILDGVSVERFTTKINNHSKMQSRKAEEERLKGLGATTIDRLLALRVAAAAQGIAH
jgi:hypothetical protein